MSTLQVNVNGFDYEPAPVQPPRSDRPTSGFFAITREAAHSWLRGNVHNRSLRRESYLAQGRDMSEKEWDVNGESVILSRPLLEGEMEGVPAGTVVVLDGQHRLEACEKSGKPFVTNVAWGIDPATQRSIDSGISRSMRDVLGMDGEKYVGVLATLLRRQLLWNNGRRRFAGSYSQTTRAEQLKLLNTDPHAFRRASEIGYDLHAKPHGFHHCPASAAAQAHYLLHKIDPEEATWFMARLKDGAELTSGHPILALRQRFLNDAESARGVRRKVAMHQPLGYIIRAWNAQRAGIELDRILQPAETNIPDPK
jgi:hypothetical protein